MTWVPNLRSSSLQFDGNRIAGRSKWITALSAGCGSTVGLLWRELLTTLGADGPTLLCQWLTGGRWRCRQASWTYGGLAYEKFVPTRSFLWRFGWLVPTQVFSEALSQRRTVPPARFILFDPTDPAPVVSPSFHTLQHPSIATPTANLLTISPGLSTNEPFRAPASTASSFFHPAPFPWP